MLFDFATIRCENVRGLKTSWLESQPFEESDQKPILFLIHGFPDQPYTWEEQFRKFSKQSLVVAPFLRGSSRSPGQYSRSPNRFAIDSVLLDHLEILRNIDPEGIRPLIVMGHDIGGIHAWALARSLPARVRKLILVNAPALEQMAQRLSSLAQWRRSWYIPIFLMPKVPELILRIYGKKLLKIHSYGGEKSPALEEITDLLGHYRGAYAEWRRGSKGVSMTIGTPVLAIWGSRDPYLCVPNSKEMGGLASDFEIRILEGGHWLHREHPQRVNHLIERFTVNE